MKYKQVPFGSLKIGDWFKYQNRKYQKHLLIDMGSCIYNASTEEIDPGPYGYSYIVCLDDKKMVYIEVPEEVQS